MRRVLGTAHTSPGLQVCAGRKMRRPAKNRAITAPAMKNGRYGSSRVRFPIHAPLKPNATRTRGPRQQVEARIAPKPPTKSAPDPVCSREFSTAPTFIGGSPALFSWPLSKWGNVDFVCALPCRTCVEPNAARAQPSGGQQASVARQRALLAIHAALVHTGANDFLADSTDFEFR